MSALMVVVPVLSSLLVSPYQFTLSLSANRTWVSLREPEVPTDLAIWVLDIWPIYLVNDIYRSEHVFLSSVPSNDIWSDDQSLDLFIKQCSVWHHHKTFPSEPF